MTYAYVEDDLVAPLPRMLEVEDYLDYLTNRTVPDVEGEIKKVLEGLWSTSAVAGSTSVATQFQLACAACNLPLMDVGELADRVFMIMLTDFLDTYTFSLKNVMKCCKEILLPDGKQISLLCLQQYGLPRSGPHAACGPRARPCPGAPLRPRGRSRRRATWSRCASCLAPVAGGSSRRRSCASGSSSGIRGSPTTTSPTDDECCHRRDVHGSR